MDSTFTRIERPTGPRTERSTDHDRTGMAGHAFDSALAGVEVELERRNGLRRPLQVRASLLPLGGADAITCTSDNIGEGGMHAVVPIGYGVAVGQRYELVLGKPSRPLDDSRSFNVIGILDNSSVLLAGEGHYATVVRTELIIKDQGHQVGIGLRFDQPLVI